VLPPRCVFVLGYGAHVILLADLLNQPELRSCGGGKTHNFGSRCFVVQVRTKESLVLASLLAGYDTILSDMDISFIKNPLLYMVSTRTARAAARRGTRTKHGVGDENTGADGSGSP